MASENCKNVLDLSRAGVNYARSTHSGNSVTSNLTHEENENQDSVWHGANRNVNNFSAFSQLLAQQQRSAAFLMNFAMMQASLSAAQQAQSTTQNDHIQPPVFPNLDQLRVALASPKKTQVVTKCDKGVTKFEKGETSCDNNMTHVLSSPAKQAACRNLTTGFSSPRSERKRTNKQSQNSDKKAHSVTKVPSGQNNTDKNADNADMSKVNGSPQKKPRAVRKLHLNDTETKSPVSGMYITELSDVSPVKNGTKTSDNAFLLDDSARFVVVSEQAKSELAKIQNVLGPYICCLCKVTFADAFRLAQHKCPRIVHAEYRCAECTKVFSCPANLASHRRWHKPNDVALKDTDLQGIVNEEKPLNLAGSGNILVR